MTETSNRDIERLDAALKAAELEHGGNSIEVAQCLSDYSTFLKNARVRLLDSANMEARSRAIRTGDSRPDQQPPVQHGNSKAKTIAAPVVEMNSFGLPVSMVKSASASTVNLTANGKPSSKSVAWATGIGLFLLFCAIPRNHEQQTQYQAASYTASQTTINSRPSRGDECYVVHDTLAAFSEKAYSGLLDAVGAHDKVGLLQMISDGDITPLAAGTKVLVLGIGGPWLSCYKVRLLGGPDVGQVCYLDCHSVRKQDTSQ